MCGQGQITLRTETGEIQLATGDAALIPPHVLHLKSHVQPNTKGYAISFQCERRNHRDTTDLYDQLQAFVSGTQILIYRSQPSLYTSVDRIIAEAGHIDRRIPVLHLAELLLSMLELPYTVEQSSMHGEQGQGSDIQRMMELDKLIATAYQRDWNNRTIAEQLFISSRQLDRIVRKRYGRSLHQVIMDKRMEIAVQLLTSTDTPVHTLASTVGFSSTSGFYREFKKRYHMTPAEYREQYAEMPPTE